MDTIVKTLQMSWVRVVGKIYENITKTANNLVALEEEERSESTTDTS